MSTTLQKLTIRNFKQFDDVEIELGDTVVFIGPNNSGKTTALQALSLWYFGIQKWIAEKGDKTTTKRTRVPINRKDLFSIPNTSARMLWRNLTTQKQKTTKGEFDIIITIEGITDNKLWRCGMEFRFNNDEALYCQPIKQQEPFIPEEAKNLKFVFLHVMSGLAITEPRVDAEYIEMMIGEGRTAEVLRNMCYLVYQTPHWEELVDSIKKQFGIIIQEPILERGTITLEYKQQNIVLDLLSSGSGMRQVLYILTHLYLNQNVVLLLDEPDSHLEILRQRNIYTIITDLAKRQNSKIIIASHSETVLDEAINRKDKVITFINRPHLFRKKDDLVKALGEIPFSDYYLISQTGWILYLEAPSDYEILKAFAKKINHTVLSKLENTFVYYLRNDDPRPATRHFNGLKEAEPQALGVLIMDRLENEFSEKDGLRKLMWRRNEIENYIFDTKAVISYLTRDIDNQEELDKTINIINKFIDGEMPANAKDDQNHLWWENIKMSDDFLAPLFETYFKTINQYNDFRKRDYYILVEYLQEKQIHPEIIEKLDAIYEVAQRAKPRE